MMEYSINPYTHARMNHRVFGSVLEKDPFGFAVPNGVFFQACSANRDPFNHGSQSPEKQRMLVPNPITPLEAEPILFSQERQATPGGGVICGSK